MYFSSLRGNLLSFLERFAPFNLYSYPGSQLSFPLTAGLSSIVLHSQSELPDSEFFETFPGYAPVNALSWAAIILYFPRHSAHLTTWVQVIHKAFLIIVIQAQLLVICVLAALFIKDKNHLEFNCSMAFQLSCIKKRNYTANSFVLFLAFPPPHLINQLWIHGFHLHKHMKKNYGQYLHLIPLCH